MSLHSINLKVHYDYDMLQTFSPRERNIIAHTGKQWLNRHVARAWRSWRIKAKRKHAAVLQRRVFYLIIIVEAILPWIAIIFAIAPPVCQVISLRLLKVVARPLLCLTRWSRPRTPSPPLGPGPQALCPRLWLYPVLTLLTCIWLRVALVPPALHPFGVLASEFPIHPVIGHAALTMVAVAQGPRLSPIPPMTPGF